MAKGIKRLYFVYDCVDDKILGTKLSSKDVGKLINIQFNCVASRCSNETLTHKRYMIFEDKDNYPAKLSKLSVSNTRLSKQISQLRKEFKLKIKSAYLKTVEGNLRFNKYHVLDDEGLPIKTFNNINDLAGEIGMSKHSAGQKLIKISKLSLKSKPNICRMSDYNKVREHYF